MIGMCARPVAPCVALAWVSGGEARFGVRPGLRGIPCVLRSRLGHFLKGWGVLVDGAGRVSPRASVEIDRCPVLGTQRLWGGRLRAHECQLDGGRMSDLGPALVALVVALDDG
jgi:hypothetical protein